MVCALCAPEVIAALRWLWRAENLVLSVSSMCYDYEFLGHGYRLRIYTNVSCTSALGGGGRRQGGGRRRGRRCGPLRNLQIIGLVEPRRIQQLVEAHGVLQHLDDCARVDLLQV